MSEWIAAGETRFFVDLHGPERAPATLVCLPGGGMTRAYFDLGGEDAATSFAGAMAAKGWRVALVDQPGAAAGAGGFGPDADPWEAAAAHAALARTLAERFAAPTVGVGHSMGAASTLLAQAAGAAHLALVLLGSGTQGLPAAQLPDEAGYNGDTAALRRDWRALAARREEAQRQWLAEKARDRDAGYREAGLSRRQFGGDDPVARALLRQAGRDQYQAGALISLIAGPAADAAEGVTVPVMLVAGADDICLPPAETARSFTASPAVETLVLPETGHNHFVGPDPAALFADIDGFLRRALSG